VNMMRTVLLAMALCCLTAVADAKVGLTRLTVEGGRGGCAYMGCTFSSSTLPVRHMLVKQWVGVHCRSPHDFGPPQHGCSCHLCCMYHMGLKLVLWSVVAFGVAARAHDLCINASQRPMVI